MRKLHITSAYTADREKWLGLLTQAGIKPENTIEEVFGLFDGDRLAATAARFRNIIKCVAVAEAYQGSNVFNELIGGVYNEVFEKGYASCFVYTKKDAKDAFGHLGFREIEHVDDKLYFMEHAVSGFQDYIKNLNNCRRIGQNAEVTSSKGEENRQAAIVMNANPFTIGHLHLVTQASMANETVHLFVLSEDMSAFSTVVRTELVKQGTAHLKNVILHPTSDYMVSAATFPAYYLKECDDTTEIQARLDARIFMNHIAPALGITVRYVGTEPFSVATGIYNDALKKEFGGALELVVLDRVCVGQEVVSASTVRKLLAAGELEEAGKLVPPTTYRYFLSEPDCGLAGKRRNSTDIL